MIPAKQVSCRCPMYGGQIQHLWTGCAVVMQRRAALRLYAVPKGGVVCVFNPIRRRLRTAKRRAGRQAAA